MCGGGGYIYNVCVCVGAREHSLSLRKHFKNSIRQQEVECLEEWQDNSVVLDVITKHSEERRGECLQGGGIRGHRSEVA